MFVEYKRLIDPEIVLPPLLAGITGKPEKPLTLKSWRKLLLAEHSPTRSIFYRFEIHNLPYYASVHLSRHKIGVEHFVQSQRINEDRCKAPQGNPVQHGLLVNAQALINIARVRLCHNASLATQAAVTQIKMALLRGDEYDASVAACMRPKCFWFDGRCPEYKPCGKRGDIKGLLFDKFF